MLELLLLFCVGIAPMLFIGGVLTLLTIVCITRGFGALFGAPMPPRWWMIHDERDEAIYEMHRSLRRE